MSYEEINGPEFNVSMNESLSLLKFEDLNPYILYKPKLPLPEKVFDLIAVADYKDGSLVGSDLPSLSYFTYLLLVLVNDFTHDHMKNTERAYSGKKGKDNAGADDVAESKRNEELVRRILYGKKGGKTFVQDNSMIIVFSYVIYLIRMYIPHTPRDNYNNMVNSELFCNFHFFIQSLELKESSTQDNMIKNKVILLINTLKIIFKSYQEILNSLTSNMTRNIHKNCYFKEVHCRNKFGTFSADDMETNIFQIYNKFAHEHHFTTEIPPTVFTNSEVKPHFTDNAYIQSKSYRSSHSLLTDDHVYSHDYILETLASITDPQHNEMHPVKLGIYKKERGSFTNKLNSDDLKTMCSKTFELHKPVNMNPISGNIQSDNKNNFNFTINTVSGETRKVKLPSKYYQTDVKEPKKSMDIKAEYWCGKIKVTNKIRMNNKEIINSSEIFEFSDKKKVNPAVYGNVRKRMIDKILNDPNMSSSLQNILSTNFSRHNQQNSIKELMTISSKKTFGDLYQILTTFSVTDTTFPPHEYGLSAKKYIIFGNHDLTASIIFNFMLFFLEGNSIPDRCCMVDHYNDTRMFTKQQENITITIPFSRTKTQEIIKSVKDNPSRFTTQTPLKQTNEVLENISEISQIEERCSELLGETRAGVKRKRRSYSRRKNTRKKRKQTTKKKKKNKKRSRKRSRKKKGGSVIVETLNQQPTKSLQSTYTSRPPSAGVKRRFNTIDERFERNVYTILDNYERLFTLFHNTIQIIQQRLDIIKEDNRKFFSKSQIKYISSYETPERVIDFMNDSKLEYRIIHLGIKNYIENNFEYFYSLSKYDQFTIIHNFLSGLDIFKLLKFPIYFLTRIENIYIKYQDNLCIC